MTNGMGNTPKCAQLLCAVGRGCYTASGTNLGCSGWEFRWWHLALGRRVSSAAHLPAHCAPQTHNSVPKMVHSATEGRRVSFTENSAKYCIYL